MMGDEIRSSRALRFFGVALCASNLLTALHWGPLDGFLRTALSDPLPLCWPFLSECATARALALAYAGTLLAALAGLSLCAAILWLSNRAPRAAWFAACVAFGLKLVILVQDYRLSGNFHYMSDLMWIVFLFAPRKKGTLLGLLTSFYAAAGLLKLNAEWLSGAALIRPTLLQGAWLRMACAYVVVLELVLVWGLLSSRRRVLIATLAQLLVFHAFSWHIVGYFYPLTMLCLLMLPILLAREGYIFARREVWWPGLAIFWIAQALPWFFPGDNALTGEGRLFSVTMLDAFSECRHFALLRSPTRFDDRSSDFRSLGVRIACDPITVWNHARQLCQSDAGLASGEAKLRIDLFSKRKTDPSFSHLIDEDDFCRAAPRFSWTKHNEWLRTASQHTDFPVVELEDNMGDVEVSIAKNGRVYGLDPQTKQPRWTSVVGEFVSGASCSLNGKTLVPILEQDTYGLSFLNRVVAFDSRHGRLLWRTHSISEAPLHLECPASGDSPEISVHGEDGLIQRIDTKNGQTIEIRSRSGGSP